MKIFTIGNYVVSKYEINCKILHITTQLRLDFIEADGGCRHYRIAKNIDYFNSLSIHEKAKFLHNFRCCDVCVYRNTDVCHNTSSNATTCEDGLELWLEDNYDGWSVE